MNYEKKALEHCVSIALHWSSDCNMACQYCYIDKDKHAMASHNRKIREALADGTFVKNIKEKFDHVKDNIENLSLWGAEPTINGIYFKDTIYECLDFFPNVNSLMFSTNALLGANIIYEQFYLPLLEYAESRQRSLTFELQLSLDGPPEFNDKSRHEGATANTLNTLYALLEKTPRDCKYFKFSVSSKSTLDISYMREMVEGGIEKFQWYYDFMNEIHGRACDIVKDNPTIDTCHVFGIPTLVDPGYYTVEDGKIFAKWLSMLKEVDRSKWHPRCQHIPLFFQCLNTILEAGDIKNPIVDGYNCLSCSSGKYNYSIDFDGTIYTCNRLCRNAALNNNLKYKGAMLSNSSIDHPNEKKWLKRNYANQIFHDDIVSRKNFMDALVFMMAKAGQIKEEYIYNEDMRLVLFYMMCGIYCHIGAEEDYTSNPFIPPASYLRLLGNGAQQELEKYLKIERARGVL